MNENEGQKAEETEETEETEGIHPRKQNRKNFPSLCYCQELLY
jgi:hypothetical protein